MAVSETTTSLAVNILLNNGTSNGNVKTVSVSLPGLSMSEFASNPTVSNNKVMNIVTLLGDCLSKPVYTVRKVVVSTLSSSDDGE